MKIDFNNKANLHSYAQVVADISMMAQNLINQEGYYDYDSMALSMEIAEWAEDFEVAWQTLQEGDLEYIEKVDAYARRKLNQYFENIPSKKEDMKHEDREWVWMRVGMNLNVTSAHARLLMSGCGIGKDIIRLAIANDEYMLDGETYIPGDIRNDYARRNRMDWDYGEVSWEL